MERAVRAAVELAAAHGVRSNGPRLLKDGGDVLVTKHGLVWNDVEDTWRGPVHWDLATMATTSRIDGAAAVAAYPGAVDPDLLELYRAVRDLQAMAWTLASAANRANASAAGTGPDSGEREP